MTQQIQQAQQLQPPSDAARLFAVEKDVAGLKESMASLATTVTKGFESISSDLKAEAKARSTTNWAPISILATVLIALGTLGIGYLSSNQGRLEALIAKQEARTERYVPREDLVTWIHGLEKNVTDRFQVSADRRNDLQVRTDDRIMRTERDIEAIQKSVVPRGEHEQMLAGQRTKDEAVQRQIDDLRKGLTDLNTPRDTIQGMQRRIDELERERRRPADR